jgi:hypothetical protein
VVDILNSTSITILNEQGELRKESKEVLVTISEEVDCHKRQLFHINQFNQTINLLESIAERQFQTSIFTSMLLFGFQFPRLTTLFSSRFGIPIEIFLIVNWIITIASLVTSVYNYTMANIYPFGLPLKETILKFLALFTLTIYNITLSTFVISNAPYLHPFGYAMTTLSTLILDRLFYAEKIKLTTLCQSSMVPWFHRSPTLFRNLDQSMVARLARRYGVIFKTLLYQIKSLVIQGLLGVVLRKCQFFNLIEIPDNKDNKYPSLKFLFEHFSVKYEITEIFVYTAGFLGTYIVLEVIYYTYGNRYWMMVEPNISTEVIVEERLEMKEELIDNVSGTNSSVSVEQEPKQANVATFPGTSSLETNVSKCDGELESFSCASNTDQQQNNKDEILAKLSLDPMNVVDRKKKREQPQNACKDRGKTLSNRKSLNPATEENPFSSSKKESAYGGVLSRRTQIEVDIESIMSYSQTRRRIEERRKKRGFKKENAASSSNETDRIIVIAEVEEKIVDGGDKRISKSVMGHTETEKIIVIAEVEEKIVDGGDKRISKSEMGHTETEDTCSSISMKCDSDIAAISLDTQDPLSPECLVLQYGTTTNDEENRNKSVKTKDDISISASQDMA